ncbi:MAG: PilZ domain-containing protein [Candidatus Omnitrophica bacterium]|nr:PilZ domain-containing protein [Candidatus Omnitrophota bacterium]
MFDLSEYGMAVSTNYNIPVRTLLQIKFTLINLNAPAEDQVKSMQITAEVKSNIQVDKDEYRLGLSFAEIKEEDRMAIAQFVKESSFRKKDG